MKRPGPEASLITLSAGCAARRESFGELGARLACRVDWQRLLAMLGSRRLLSQLGPRVVELSAGGAPASFVSTVERSLAQTRRQAVLLQLVSERLTVALAEAGIASMALKGVVLAEAIYGDLGARPASDIDVLVAPRDLHAAVAVVRRFGYGPPSGDVGPDGLPLLHLLLLHGRGQQPPVELHWRVHWYEHAFAEQMLARGVAHPRQGRRPLPVDELASLLLFYARDGFVDLRLATDIGAWWDVFGSRLRPGALAALLRGYPALAPSLGAAACVAETLVGVPATSLLGPTFVLDMRARLAAKLANANPRASLAQLSADVHLVDWLLAPRSGTGDFVRRQLALSSAVANAPSQARWRLRCSHAGYFARLLVRSALTLTRGVARTRKGAGIAIAPRRGSLESWPRSQPRPGHRTLARSQAVPAPRPRRFPPRSRAPAR